MKTNKFISSLALVTLISFTAASNNNTSGNDQAPDAVSEMKAAQEKAKRDFEEFKRKANEDYNTYKEDAISRYVAFRDSVLSEFVKHMKQPWKKEESKPAVPKPIDKSIEPEIIPLDEQTIAETPKEETSPIKEEVPQSTVPPVKEDNQETRPVQDTKPKRETPKVSPINNSIHQLPVKDVVDISNIDFNIKALPFVPVIVPEDDEPEVFRFTFFGTPVAVRIDDSCRFTLSSIDNKGISSAMEEITKNELINVTLGDCIDIREDLQLCDWAYLEMLMSLSQSFYGSECNEATLLTGYLFCMSGYKMRFAYNENKLHILFASDQYISDLPFYTLSSDGYCNYYCLSSERIQQIHVCEYAFPNEKSLSLHIEKLPKFAPNEIALNKKLHSYPIHLSYSVNKNLIDFFDTYPTPQTENDAYSKWLYYAKAPLSNEAKEGIYPTLKSAIEGKSEYEAVNIIMDWIESYKYGYDTEIWGFDRAFFPDETIFYPSSDCEDHAILFTRIVSDLLGLKTALVYYPGHLAAAVKFNSEVEGDYIAYKGTKYTVCDPTIYYAKAGRTMKSVKNTQATLIILQ
ncbi:MAG: hypothetical protein IJ328_02165 [Muribaculaceae bacterium]|nr:hypothetical protein [Muribaculaceae bacterium]